jgi:hypothetical protein
MRYKINDTVVVISSDENKIISDCEIILGTEIYYMTDKTSYCLSQLKDYYDFNNNKELVNEIVNSPGLKEITDTKLNDFTKNVIKWYYSNPPTPIKPEIKYKKWFNLF